ncbi:7033_t:CDS:2, partial [Scutellospora calospora]
TIIKVRYVHPSTKEDSNLITLWAISTYPVRREDYVIEMVLFVLNNPDKRDFETQAIFERDSYYSIGGKIVPGIYKGKKKPKILFRLFINFTGYIYLYVVFFSSQMTVSISTHVMILNKAPELNKCPLRISLIEELLVFIVRQLEVIHNDFYIYAKDISVIDTTSFRRRIFDNSSTNLSEVVNATQSKLFSTYRNINESQKGIDKFKTSSLNVSNDSVDNNFQLASCSKHVRTEHSDEFTNMFNDTSGDEKCKRRKNVKKGVGRHLRSDSKLSKSDTDIVNSK